MQIKNVMLRVEAILQDPDPALLELIDEECSDWW